MLLYTLTTKDMPIWVLDLTGPAQGPAEVSAPSVYALVVPSTPAQVYIGSTKNLRSRIRQHLTRSRSELLRGPGSHRLPRTTAAAVLERVVSGRNGLLVIRLEAVAPGNEALLRRLELAWLLVAAREELPVRRQRGHQIQWSGDPGEMRAAFRLARKRNWPGPWIRILKPLCENYAACERDAVDPPGLPPSIKRRATEPKAGGAKGTEAPGRAP